MVDACAAAPEWEVMVEEFRSLGGRMDNVSRRLGPVGYGLFATDPGRPVDLHTPSNLLIPLDRIAFVDGAPTVAPDAGIGAREAAFFNRYQAQFSWGAEGRDSAAEYVAAIDRLPEEARRLLRREFHADALFQDNTAERRFLSSRAIRIDGVKYLMPVAELVNHAPDGAAFDKTAGVRVTGRFSDEIRVRYRRADPFQIFVGWGFASAEPLAFSLPLALNIDGRMGVVYRRLNARAVRAAETAPRIDTQGKAIQIPCLLLGDRAAPGKARSIFRQAMDEQRIANADAYFDQILAINTDRFMRLSALLAREVGAVATKLCETCSLQLDILLREGA